MVPVEKFIVAAAQVSRAVVAEFRSRLVAAVLVAFQLFGAAEPSYVAHLNLFTGLDAGNVRGTETGVRGRAGTWACSYHAQGLALYLRPSTSSFACF